MQQRFPGVGLRLVHLRAMFNQKLNELPVTMEHGLIQAEIPAEQLKGFSLPSRNRIALTSPWSAHHLMSATPSWSVEFAGWPSDTQSNTRSVRPSVIR